VQVITRQTMPPSPAVEMMGQVRVRRIPPAGRLKGVGWKAMPAMLGYLWRLLVLLMRESRHYDVVVISCMKIIPVVAVPVCRLLGKKCIIRLESPFEIVQPIASESLATMSTVLGGGLTRSLRRLQRWMLNRADRVVAISDEIERLLCDAGTSPARIVRIPNGIDLARFRPPEPETRAQLRACLGIPPGRTVALFTGRVSRAKGIGMLVEQWPTLLANHQDLLLLVVGSGKDSWDDCEDYVRGYIARHGLREHVAMVGHSERVTEYMQAADLFVFPSEYEGFGLAVTEALATGLPSVLSAVGIAAEVVTNGVNGFLFQARDPEALKQAIGMCLARREDWPDIGSRARQAVAHCDKPRVFDQFADLCRQLHVPRSDRQMAAGAT
jgi:glycosyltransferase involved in cell wall biosynthesis